MKKRWVIEAFSINPKESGIDIDASRADRRGQNDKDKWPVVDVAIASNVGSRNVTISEIALLGAKKPQWRS